MLGGWVTGTEDTDVRLMFDRHSRHSAWRAAQWWDRLPVLADVERAALCLPPSDAFAEVFDHLAALPNAVARLAGGYRVALPRLWARYEYHRKAAGETSDSSTLRALQIVSPDLAADWHEGEQLLQELLTEDVRVGEAGGVVAALEGLLTTAG